MAALPLSLLPDPDTSGAVPITVEARIADEPIQTVVDTGGSSGSFTTTAQTENLDVVMPRLSLGSIVFRDVRASRMPPGDKRPSHVGMDVLGQHPCHFRFTSSVLEINEPIPPPSEPRFPLAALPGGQPVIHVQLGSNEVAAMWDSGAGLTAIDESFTEANPHLVKITGQTEGLDSSGTRFTTRTATLTSCTIGGVQFPSKPHAWSTTSGHSTTPSTPRWTS